MRNSAVRFLRNMAFKLAVTASYREEFNMAENYISNVLFSPIAAHNLAVRLDQAVSLIESNPFIFPLYHDEKIAKRGYRFASVSNYLLFYRVDENNKVIYLLHFLNGRQNIQMYIK